MALALHRRGLFSQSEWAQGLATAIASAQAAGDPDLGDTYYSHWLAALETLVVAKGLISRDEMVIYQRAWDRAARRTPHGLPLELQPDDLAG
jgi:nitrile hydratase accessory protein